MRIDFAKTACFPAGLFSGRVDKRSNAILIGVIEIKPPRFGRAASSAPPDFLFPDSFS
jgi:hypothetical protein